MPPTITRHPANIVRTPATLAFTLALLGSTPIYAGDWITAPSTFTHDPVRGVRVAQYQPIAKPTSAVTPRLSIGGYHHTRSTLNYGTSADNYLRVERYGDPVRPYGEFRFPYRPYSVPYGGWGPPLAGASPSRIGGDVFAPNVIGVNPAAINSGNPAALNPTLGNQAANFPGTNFPGTNFPGTNFPGTNFPGGISPGGRVPRVTVPGDYGNLPFPYPESRFYRGAPPYYDGYHPVYRD